jgi:hypothetical protein
MSIHNLTMLLPSTEQTALSDSTHLGLQNLQSRYKLLTNHVPEIEERQEEFIVKLPLIA